ncbi:MAG: SLBB domain-containing protein [Candidatus Korobacteraceae bacterium]|jgi:protein involved in polysaccharide export with SLBB domain
MLIFSQAAYGAQQNSTGQNNPKPSSNSLPFCSDSPETAQGACIPLPAPTVAPEEGQPATPVNAPKPTQPQLPIQEKQVKKVELTDFQKLVEESLGKPLPIYGASLFENVPTTFAPVDRAPVTADYVIGPGDELMIRAWGQIDLDVHARVDRNGNIFLPKVGSVNVAGLKYAQIENYLKSHIGRIYQNFDLNVTMGELRSIDIYVVGQATRPGRYTVSSLSTLTNAIFASGGPSPHGSMREIQLKRGGNVVTTFDLYDLLLKGDKSKDVVLQPEDVIYVLPTGPQVAMGGQINVPGIYELKTETTLSDGIRLSGGLTNTAFGGKVYVEHIVNRRVHSVEEVPLDTAGMVHPLVDGDIVNFTAVSPKFENSVTLRGNVAQPGRYPWHSGMRISDLIPNREFLITREYWKQQNTIALESETTGGHVKGTAGTVNSVKRNAPEIDWNYAVVQRMSTEDLSTQLIPFDLGKAILGQDAASNVTLQPGDIITIFSQADLKVPEGQQTKLITLTGEFGSAGVYRVMHGENLREAIQKAGGITPSAYLYASQFTRESARVEQQARLDLLIAQAERDVATSTAKRAQSAQTAQEVSAANASFEAERLTLEKLRQLKAEGRIVLNIHPDDHTVDSIPDIPLEDGDQFYIPARPIAVSVVGDVYSPGSYIQQPGKTVNAYLRNAGGPTRNADSGRTFVVRANGAVVSKDAAGKFWGGGFESMVLMPGDTVVVPPNTDKGAGLRNFKDWSQILFNFGLAAAAINVLK